MELVSAGDNCGSDQRKYRIQQQAGARQAHPPGAQPKHAHRSVPDEVSSFANVVMHNVPVLVGDATEEVFPHPA